MPAAVGSVHGRASRCSRASQAAIRRLIVISAEAENLLGTVQFRDVVLEIGVLAGTVLLLGATVLLLRVTRRDEEPAADSTE